MALMLYTYFFFIAYTICNTDKNLTCDHINRNVPQPPTLEKGTHKNLVCLKTFSCYKCIIEGDSLGTRGWAWGKKTITLTLSSDGALQKVSSFFPSDN